MKAIIFYPSSGDQQAEFEREAKAAAKFFGCQAYPFPAMLPHPHRRSAIITTLQGQRDLELVLFLCHGWRTGIQAGFDLDSAGDLAAAIARASVQGVHVGLYCCSTGRGPGIDRDGEGEAVGPGEGSFADDLRDGLVSRGAFGGQMFCHTTPGHLSRNPDVRLYRIASGEMGGVDVCPLYPELPAGVKRTIKMRSESRELYQRWRGVLHLQDGRWQVCTMPLPAIMDLVRVTPRWLK